MVAHTLGAFCLAGKATQPLEESCRRFKTAPTNNSLLALASPGHLATSGPFGRATVSSTPRATQRITPMERSASVLIRTTRAMVDIPLEVQPSPYQWDHPRARSSFRRFRHYLPHS